ncbi:unnamed protein product [Arctogadus glacialis]
MNHVKISQSSLFQELGWRKLDMISSGQPKSPNKQTAAMAQAKDTHKWTPQETRRLINFRATRDNEFLKSKMIARKQLFLEEMGMEGKVTRQQASKKWENLKKKYKDLRTPKTGSGTESGEVTVATWQYYDLMHKVLGARPAIYPPVLVSSIQDSMVILMVREMVEPYTQAPPTAASIPVHPTTSIIPPRRRSKTVAELLAEEALQEQRRHEDSAMFFILAIY